MRGCAPLGATARDHNPTGGPCRRRARSAAGTGLRPEPPPFAVPGRRCHAPSKAARSSRRSLERPRSLVRPRDDGDPSPRRVGACLKPAKRDLAPAKGPPPVDPHAKPVSGHDPGPRGLFGVAGPGGRMWTAPSSALGISHLSRRPGGCPGRRGTGRGREPSGGRPQETVSIAFSCTDASGRGCSRHAHAPHKAVRLMVAHGVAPRGLGGKFLTSQKKEGPRTTLEAFNEEKKGRVRSARSD